MSVDVLKKRLEEWPCRKINEWVLVILFPLYPILFSSQMKGRKSRGIRYLGERERAEEKTRGRALFDDK